MMCRNIEIGSVAAFSIIVGRRSGPQALWSFNFRRRLIMPCLSILMSSIGSQRASTGGGMTDMSSLLNTKLYCPVYQCYVDNDSSGQSAMVPRWLLLCCLCIDW